MRGFLERMQWKMALWMEGRYGPDSLSNALFVAGLVLVLLSVIPGLDLLWLLGMIALVLSVFRSMSKNIARRERENDAWQRIIKKPQTYLSWARKSWAGRATTRYFICKGCGTILSVPKGKGKLRITCPRCHTQTEKKS